MLNNIQSQTGSNRTTKQQVKKLNECSTQVEITSQNSLNNSFEMLVKIASLVAQVGTQKLENNLTTV